MLGVDHEAKLMANQSDPVVAAILVSFSPVLQSFKVTDVNLRIALGEYKGETQTVEELFTELSKVELPSWELPIFMEFPKGSPEATALLPQGRKPFQTGTYESRIQEIKVLGDKCAAITNLLPLSVNILAFHVQIESARQLQQSSGEGQVVNLRSLRETARVSLCQAMYGNLALLMNHHKTDPTLVANYFDLSLVRHKSSKSKPVVAAGTISNAQTGELVEGAVIKFTLPDNVVITVITDDMGEFEVELGTFTTAVEVQVEITAAGFITFNESGMIEPNDDIDMDIELVPESQPAPINPTP